MDQHELALNLQHSRARLRELLIPDPETGQIEADVFPRSTAMRALVSSLPLLATVAARHPLLRVLAQGVGLRLP